MSQYRQMRLPPRAAYRQKIIGQSYDAIDYIDNNWASLSSFELYRHAVIYLPFAIEKAMECVAFSLQSRRRQPQPYYMFCAQKAGDAFHLKLSAALLMPHSLKAYWEPHNKSIIAFVHFVSWGYWYFLEAANWNDIGLWKPSYEACIFRAFIVRAFLSKREKAPYWRNALIDFWWI